MLLGLNVLQKHTVGYLLIRVYFQMSAQTMRLISAVCVAIVILSIAGLSEANYKNAPMNGIMFGKRGPLGMFVI